VFFSLALKKRKTESDQNFAEKAEEEKDPDSFVLPCTLPKQLGSLSRIKTIEMHTSGEPVRIVVSGYPPVPGTTILEKRRYVKEHFDHFRTMLMHEPRGSSLHCFFFSHPLWLNSCSFKLLQVIVICMAL
jgi:hypothetical protein